MTRASLTLALVLALSAAACGKKEEAVTNDAVAEAAFEQENVIGNDVTAIDAATADDARMAADVPPPEDGEFDNAAGNAADNGSSGAQRPSPRPRSRTERSAPAPAAEPADTAEPAAGNDAA